MYFSNLLVFIELVHPISFKLRLAPKQLAFIIQQLLALPSTQAYPVQSCFKRIQNRCHWNWRQQDLGRPPIY